MASRMNRYAYSDRVSTQVKARQEKTRAENNDEKLQDFVNIIQEKLGKNGSITFLDKKNEIPLIGQLTNDRFIGVTIFENNLFHAPIFIHKAPETDFVFVKNIASNGNRKYYLRKIDYIYTVGQIEPKVEVFNPSSRALKEVIKKSAKHVIKEKFANSQSVNTEELKKLFPTIPAQNMKQLIKSAGGEIDPTNNKQFYYNKDLVPEKNEENQNNLDSCLSPEEMCLYERMHASNIRLKNIGLESYESCDKINLIRDRYVSRNNQKISKNPVDYNQSLKLAKMNIIANFIAEELQLTAWNLSENFLKSKQQQGRMCLTGFGDPTAGHGGYSYVKLPLKTSRYEMKEKKNMKKSEKITGSEADLRSLSNDYVDKMLIKYGGEKVKDIQNLQRWDKRRMLAQIAKENPNNEELAKFSRDGRLTLEMQREKYQQEINQHFMKLVDSLSNSAATEAIFEGQEEFEYNLEQLAEKELERIFQDKQEKKGQNCGSSDFNDGNEEYDD